MSPPLQLDAIAPVAGELVRVEPIPFSSSALSPHGSWGLTASLAVHAVAAVAFGGWVAGWTPSWIPPPAGISSQAQSGDRYASVAAAPASEAADSLPVKIEVKEELLTREVLTASQVDAHERVASGRPSSLVLPDAPPAPPPGDERSLAHAIEATATGAAETRATLPASLTTPTPPRRTLASDRPHVSTQAIGLSSPAAIGSRGQAGAQTNAPPRAVYSPEPTYPPQALAAGQIGKVVVRIRVDSTGQVIAARVQTTSGNRLLDDAAIVAVRRWRFEPRPDGGSSSVDFAVPVVFEIEKKT